MILFWQTNTNFLVVSTFVQISCVKFKSSHKKHYFSSYSWKRSVVTALGALQIFCRDNNVTK